MSPSAPLTTAPADQPLPDRAGRGAGAPQGITFAVGSFLPIIAVFSLSPAVPSMLQRFATVPMAATLVPLMVTIPGLMIALFSPVAGWVADRFGRRRLVIVATCLYGVFGLIPFFLSNLYAIFACRIVVGITEAAVTTTIYALMTDYFPSDRRRFWLTLQSVIGPAFGTVIVAGAGRLTDIRWNGAFLIYLLAFPIAAAMIAYFYEPERTETAVTNDAAPPLPWATVAGYVGVSFAAAVLFYAFIVQGGMAFQAIGVTSAGRIGTLMAIATAGIPLGGLLFGVLGKRLSSPVTIGGTFALMGAGLLILGLTRDQTVMIGAAFVQQVGAGLCIPALIFWVSTLLGPDGRGRGFGIWNAAFCVGQVASPIVMSFLMFGGANVLPAFVAFGVIALAGTLPVVWLVRRISHRAPASPLA